MKRFRSVLAIFTVSLVFVGASLLHFMPSLPNFKASPKASSPATPSIKPPSGIPDKFDPDGNVQHFPGNTIICHLSNSTELYSSLLVLYDRLKQSPHSHLYTLLPPSSWHMTVFDGVAYKRRKPGFWPRDLPMDSPLEECTALYEKRLSSFDLQTSLPLRLSILAPAELKSAIKLQVKPHTADNAALRDVRERLATLLDIHNPDREGYVFHISLAYILRHLTGEQKTELMSLVMDHFMDMPKEFELGPPEFCKYENMFGFEPLLYLKNREN